MLFYLTMLHLARFLWEDPPVVDESDTNTARRAAYDQWVQGDFLCRNDNVYHEVQTAKEFWNSLEFKNWK
ncbi:hypothetical protein ACS0TY_001015 [Phlomoides rotata]